MSRRVADLDGLHDLGHELFAEFGDPKLQQNAGMRPDEPNVADAFARQRELRVERHKVRAEIELVKEGKDRSAGELALMFMGINQVAQELLHENPMTGYMNEIIFSRVLGHDEIEEGTYWIDASQCWVCRKHNKATLAYHMKDDREVFR